MFFGICGFTLCGIAEGTSDEVYTLYNESYNLSEAGKYEESNQKIEQILKMNTRFVDPYIQKGYNLASLGKYNESLTPLRIAIDFFKNGSVQTLGWKYRGVYEGEGNAYNNYAHSLLNLQRYNESSEMFTQAIAAYEEYLDALNSVPNPISGHSMNGKMEYEIEYPDRSIGQMNEKFDQAINSAKSYALPLLSGSYYWKGYTLYQMGMNEESLQFYNKAKAMDQSLEPYSVDVLSNMTKQ